MRQAIHLCSSISVCQLRSTTATSKKNAQEGSRSVGAAKGQLLIQHAVDLMPCAKLTQQKSFVIWQLAQFAHREKQWWRWEQSWCHWIQLHGIFLDIVRNVFWGVVTNPNGQCTVLGVPAGLKPPIWQFAPQMRVFHTWIVSACCAQIVRLFSTNCVQHCSFQCLLRHKLWTSLSAFSQGMPWPAHKGCRS